MSMKSHIIDPVSFRLDNLLSLGISQVHELARKATGRVTGYRLIVGRCLLAMRESKGFKKYGCSSEIHYATAKLGMGSRAASECRRVARSLMSLPQLSLAAEFGKIDWSKLREIVSKATPETEAFWLRLADDLEYKQIEWLVGKTPKGALPGDVFEETERSTSELRCKLSDQVLAMLDRARRLYSLEKNEAVTTAQVLEWALASYIANQPVDEESLEKVREEMDRDLQAQKAREIPLVAVARGVAAEMGFIAVPQTEESLDEISRTGDLHPINDSLTEALGGVPCLDPTEEEPLRASVTNAEVAGCCSSESEREISPTGGRCGSERHSQADESHLELLRVVQSANAGSSCDFLSTNLPPLQNQRLAFNPRNRHATKAQKREILRRESWRCSTPACSGRIWLHLHHLIPYSQGGATLPSNCVGLCTTCHRHVHEGSLRIFQQSDGSLLFTDADGNSLALQADLEIGSWLDYHNGWEGEEEDSFGLRAFAGDWAVFGKI